MRVNVHREIKKTNGLINCSNEYLFEGCEVSFWVHLALQ